MISIEKQARLAFKEALRSVNWVSRITKTTGHSPQSFQTVIRDMEQKIEQL